MMTAPAAASLIIVASYLLGSIPFGMLVTKLAGLGDIRKIGSGNIGATNVLRTGKKSLALLTLLLDGGKGAVAILIAGCLVSHGSQGGVDRSVPWAEARLILYAGLSVMVGHMFPVWLKFQGGKGVATAIGVITALSWATGLALMVTWMAIAAAFRYSSLAALGVFLAGPVYAYFIEPSDQNLFIFTVAIILPIFWKHRTNIRKLLNRTESRIAGGPNADTRTD
ncbi:MAG: glycerol-3-phosphate 1-O-acyltransferase PlsY [Pseudomonadota bacterium]|nr:glycerol-3-phosphate 1-O-acyltransferase PlsY [Pseudomonadota bacterium]